MTALTMRSDLHGKPILSLYYKLSSGIHCGLCIHACSKSLACVYIYIYIYICIGLYTSTEYGCGFFGSAIGNSGIFKE